jgi:hypothetical protein
MEIQRKRRNTEKTEKYRENGEIQRKRRSTEKMAKYREI